MRWAERAEGVGMEHAGTDLKRVIHETRESLQNAEELLRVIEDALQLDAVEHVVASPRLLHQLSDATQRLMDLTSQLSDMRQRGPGSG